MGNAPTMYSTSGVILLCLVVGVVLVGSVAMYIRRKRHLLHLDDEVRFMLGKVDEADGTTLRLRRYRIIGRLGAGGMARVYLAASSGGQRVALKIPDPRYFQTEEHRDLFRQELSVSKKMQHPNIVRILDYSDGSGEDPPYIAMEFVDGVTLDKKLPRHQPVDITFAARILHEVTLALEYAHNMGVVHRDIKPENIMLSRSGEVKVTDFGIARDLWENQGGEVESDAFVGSPHYMSPEQINSEHVDYRTDYYALGVLAYRLVTGYMPFEGDNTLEVITRKVSQLPPPPSTYVDKIPSEFEQMVRDLMQREPERRPVSTVGIRKVWRKYLAPARRRHTARRVEKVADDF